MNRNRNLRKNLSLHLVNLIGMAIMLASLLVSANYLKKEYSYDRQNQKADRIARLSLLFGSGAVDGRIYGNEIDGVLARLPEIEKVAKMYRVYSAIFSSGDNHVIANDIYMVSPTFPSVFDLDLLAGDHDRPLADETQMIISESLARRLFADMTTDEVTKQTITIEEGSKIGGSFQISGVFKDFPQTSHFRTDALTLLPEGFDQFMYTYLLLDDSDKTKDPDALNSIALKITELIEEEGLYPYESQKATALLMPLTDIHLHSHNLREMAVNGNIKYIYLIAGANLLLLIIVLFNLWLNQTLIFSYNRRYYQLLRLYGAPPSTVLRKELTSATLWGSLSIIAGAMIVSVMWYLKIIPQQLSVVQTALICIAFLALTTTISLIPAIKGIVYTRFISTNPDLVPFKFSYKNVKWMIVGQFCAVIIVVILAFGIVRQLNLTRSVQVGGDESGVLLLTDQSQKVMERTSLLKLMLEQYSEIEGFTTAFQIPGDAIRDHISVRVEGREDWQKLPMMPCGEGFLHFFGINLEAGRDFSPLKMDYQQEMQLLMERLMSGNISDNTEEYILNLKAMRQLGFESPEDALGKMLYLEHGTVDYIQKGVVVGVSEDYSYTGVYEESIPLIMMQRNAFQFCTMVRLDKDNLAQAISVFESVWNEVNPDTPAYYTFLSDSFNKLYHSEINARRLVLIFALLCFVLADLGLIVFMAFMIRKRAKEIAIRRINGASRKDIVLMLNVDFVRYYLYAFVIAVPVSWFVLHRYLEQFAYRIALSWWMFLAAGAFVLLVSIGTITVLSGYSQKELK